MALSGGPQGPPAIPSPALFPQPSALLVSLPSYILTTALVLVCVKEFGGSVGVNSLPVWPTHSTGAISIHSVKIHSLPGRGHDGYRINCINSKSPGPAQTPVNREDSAVTL